ncbi:MAG: polysaccharide deacetylase family protein [Candidatus Rokuibacteriota bacterium]
MGIPVRLPLLGATLLLTACATTLSPAPDAPRVGGPPPAAPPAAASPGVTFESEEFIVTLAQSGDTAETLAARYLGDPGRAWLIETYMGARTFTAGQEVVIPRREWNPAGVTPSGYQLVPVLVYHNLGPQARGRLVLAAQRFEEQMQYLKREGYHVITLQQFLDFTSLRRQLPSKSVLLAFDDGYKSFRQYAYPVLKSHGFTATLFVYTDYVGAGRNALSWSDLRELAAEGFDIQAHSKTHADLRRAPGESPEQYEKRMQAELAQPNVLLRQRLGRASDVLAYPYGYWDDALLEQVRRHGYVAAFTVRRQANPAFALPLRISRSQIYAEMSLEDFARALNVFHKEDLR